jgi:hypothetical protein
MVVTWYWRPETGVDKGARISLVDLDARRYQHVLLVEPRPGGDYRRVPVHAGGVAWYGTRLYVADTFRGFRVFDLDDLIDLKAVPGADLADKERAGLDGGVHRSFGYRYLLPQSGRLDRAGEARFSFAAIDRSGRPHALVSGEYAEPGKAAGRVVRWAMDADGRPGEVIEAYTLPVDKVQGAVTDRGRWYLSQAADARTNGTLHVVAADGGTVRRGYARGPEDLTVEGRRLWTVTEFPGRRALFGVNL